MSTSEAPARGGLPKPLRYRCTLHMAGGQVSETIEGDRNTVRLDNGWLIIAERPVLRMLAPGTVERVEIVEIDQPEGPSESPF